MKRVAVLFSNISRWALFLGVATVAVMGRPVMAQGEPINECFGEVVDHAGASESHGELLLLQRQVFPVAGYASVQGLSDDRIPAAKVRKIVVQLTPVYQNCVIERYAKNAERLDDLHKSHLAARVSLLHQLADGAITYAEYAKRLDMLRGQLVAGYFFWQMDM